MKKLNGIHTCTDFVISQDHVRLDSSVIAHNIVHLVKTNPSIEIKTLIADILQRFDYIVSFKKAWITKQKALDIWKLGTIIQLFACMVNNCSTLCTKYNSKIQNFIFNRGW